MYIYICVCVCGLRILLIIMSLLLLFIQKVSLDKYTIIRYDKDKLNSMYICSIFFGLLTFGNHLLPGTFLYDHCSGVI